MSNTLQSIKQLVENDMLAVNRLIQDNLSSQIGLIENLSAHIINSGGKRLRPILVILASHACGYQGDKHILLAAAVEYFHAATLLHDDVIDESALRRGQQTANEIWGDKATILVGDYLFTQAFRMVAQSQNIAVLDTIAETANTITRGEVRQLINSGNVTATEAQYMQIIHDKTAILFSTSAKIGGILAQRPADEIHALASYGTCLGQAFQIIDDALDYCGNADTIGKNIGDDFIQGKLTLPLLHVIQHADAKKKAFIEMALAKRQLSDLEAIIDAIKNSGAIDYSYRVAQRLVDDAITAIQLIPESVYKKALEGLAQFAISRDH